MANKLQEAFCMRERQEDAAKRAIACLTVNWTGMSSCDGAYASTSVRETTKELRCGPNHIFNGPAFWIT
jgi:hypothetical protein